MKNRKKIAMAFWSVGTITSVCLLCNDTFSRSRACFISLTLLHTFVRVKWKFCSKMNGYTRQQASASERTNEQTYLLLHICFFILLHSPTNSHTYFNHKAHATSSSSYKTSIEKVKCKELQVSVWICMMYKSTYMFGMVYTHIKIKMGREHVKHPTMMTTTTTMATKKGRKWN